MDQPQHESAQGVGSLIDAMHDAVVVATTDGVVLQWNAAAERLYGYPREDVLGRSLEMLYGPDARLVLSQTVARALAQGHAQLTGPMTRRDGSTFLVAGTVSVLRDEPDDRTLLVGVSRDVTMSEQLLSWLRESDASLAEAQSVAGLGSWTWDLVTHEMTWSDEMYRLLGLEPQAVAATYELYLSCVHPDDRGLAEQAVASVLAGAQSFEFDHRVDRPDQQPMWLRGRGRMVRDGHGRPSRLVGAALDITAHQQAAQELTAQRDRLAVLAAVLESTSDAVVSCTLDGLVLDWNDGAERLYGYSREEAVGRHAPTLLPTQDAPDLRRMAELLREQPSQTLARAVVRKDGSTVEVEASVSLVQGADGKTLVGISRDVTERNRLQRELAAHVSRLDEAQRLAAVGSWEWDLKTGLEVWSAECRRILGVEDGTAASYALYLDLLHPQDRARVQEQIELLDPEEPLEYEARVVRPDGELRWVATRGEVETDAQGVPVRKTGTIQDITARRSADAELQRLALTDSLTGLPNRGRFTAELQSALADADGQRRVALLLLDLDGFKDVNDGIGHDAGDLVLQEVARRLLEVIRGGDVVARLGGDEFAVVLPGVGGTQNAIQVASSVLSCLEAPFDLDGITVHVGGSIGIAVTDRRADPGVLLKQADVAMYRAKTMSSGWAVFEPDQDDLAAGRLQMVTDLRAIIERGELEVAYQPVVETRSRRVSSFEALARWHHPDKGVVPPDQFIPLAEQADLIVPLTRLVLRKALVACAEWRRRGHDLRVAVNLSVQVMETGDPCAMVAECLAEAGLAAQHLVLEITESSLASDGDRVNDILTGLRDLGVTLVIDDFGTGYSAMSYLKQLPVEELKIDRSFIRDIATDSRDLAIVRSLVRLAHSLGLRVVAEGVESLPALEVLSGLGCDFAQGYGIAPAMGEDQTADWLARYHAQSAPGAQDGRPRELLIVDDSSVVRANLTALAVESGWSVRQAASAEDALTEVARSVPDIVILDHHMTGMTGMDVVPRLRALGLDGPILLFTQFLSEAIPRMRVPLDVWPVSKSNPDGVLELLNGYRSSTDRLAGRHR